MAERALRDRFETVAFTTAVPFAEDGAAVDHDALAENVGAMEAAGGDLFVANGNTGEYFALTDEERVRIVETHVAATGEDATIVGGAEGSLGHVRRLADAYAAAGADALMVMHPGHTYIHRAGLAEYYHRICDATSLGVVLYTRGPEIHRDVLVELSEREAVVAVKFARDDVKEFAQTVEEASGDVTWVNGIAERYAPAFAIEGATGFTTGLGNFLPEVSLALFDAIADEDWERARQLRRALWPIEDLREESGAHNDLAAANNVPVVKRGLELAGLNGGSVRPPLVGLADEDAARLERYHETVTDL
jgi:4-hydroxy-tetrahydrodipicolinate synthase